MKTSAEKIWDKADRATSRFLGLAEAYSLTSVQRTVLKFVITDVIRSERNRSRKKARVQP